jgi:uncharacterized membrane protein (DUF373 family)
VWNPAPLRAAAQVLRFAERAMFALVGLLLAAAALTLAVRSLAVVYELIVSSSAQTIALTAHFLDMILLILMLAEIIYTVTISLRGAVLSPQPFLIVGLIAVIRRILVMTVEEVQNDGRAQNGWITQSSVDLAVLTLVVMAFVFAIYLLERKRGEPAAQPGRDVP